MDYNLFTHDLSLDQVEAVESLIADIGEFNFKISSLLRAINLHNTQEIQRQWPRWATIDGKIDKDKLARRIKELNKFMGV